MCYDFYSCPFEPDSCNPGDGEHPECADCAWRYISRERAECSNDINGINDTNGSNGTI